ncbi:MAG TPA: hypothetical protein P5149_14460 [Candidatus Competibacteraceae bacterium]|nr:hypothetical protein [Candidatus Competibacteraceae bacterium]MCP5133153.1 hypothetical protein [Gammaproteobacteria bacterium]HPF60186.1 hypothetical protein [Candidatus Competibacteraceae bacterium]HRY19591.1 hypothetical protein [Candidatus Competibacteraceae bacterium]
MNNKFILAAACCALLGTAGGAFADGHRGGHGRDDPPGLDDNPGRGNGPKPALTKTVLEFQTMAGVNGAFLGGAYPIRGISGGGLPWVLGAAKGELKDNGKLEVEVQGLVIPGTSNCGTDCNPAPFFQAIVSCLTVDATGQMVTDNLKTENGAEVMIGDPKAGNAKIEAVLDLPEPCIAPIVLVTSPTGAWFAVTGVGAVP